jgi:acyl-coenzyme A synthetase/AMP-(fatty) acid ligase
MGEASLFTAVREAAVPGATAVSSARGSWTYREVLVAAERTAAALERQREVDVPVLAALSDIASTLVLTLAADLGGLPLIHLDPGAATRPAGLVVNDGPDPGANDLPLREDFVLHVERTDGVALPVRGWQGQVFLTSGSTGVPTGVVRPAGAVIADGGRVAERLAYGPAAPVVASAPVFHVYGFNYALIGPVIRGAHVHHCGWQAVPSQLAAAARGTGAQVLIASPFQYRLLAEMPLAGSPDFGTVRKAVSAGAPLAAGDVSEVTRRHRFTLFNCYGSSEAGAVTLTAVTGEEPPGDVGEPLPSGTAAIRSSPGIEQGGELVLRTRSLALGRLSPAGLTPLADADGWYRSGDLAELTGDRIRLLGRLGSVINVAGKKVSPVEVERVLGAHPEVREAQVLANIDDMRGEVPVARVVVTGPVTAAELLAWCRTRLAPFQLPRRIEFHDELPRSATGKPLRPIVGGER